MTRRSSLLALFAAILLGLPGVMTGVASAQEDRRPTEILRVDATADDEVTILLRSDAPPEQLSGMEVAIAGRQTRVIAEPVLVPASEQRVVLVIEASGALNEAGGFVAIREAAKSFVTEAEGQVIAVYSVNDRVRRVNGFTDDTAQLTRNIEGINFATGHRLWDGITSAAKVLGEEQPGTVGTIVLITGTEDDGSTGGSGTARGALAAAGARLSVIVLDTGSSPEGQLERLASDAGGAIRSASDAVDVESRVLDARQGAANLYRVTYERGAAEGILQAQLTIGPEVVPFEYSDGRVTTGSIALRPSPPAKPSPLGFLGGTLGKTLGLLLIGFAVGGLVYSLVLIFSKDNELSDVLSLYTEGAQGDLDEGEANKIRNAIVQRAVDLTGQVAEQQGFLTKIENSLEQASIPLRAAEALFFYMLMVVVLMIVGAVLMGGLIGLIFFGVLGALVPVGALNFKASRRKRTFVGQLPDMLQLLAGTLRAGFSLMQGVEAVSQEVDGPMGDELRRVVTESRLGRPLEEALQGAADRMESPDFNWTVMAISIQREVGGNLAELLLTVADTMVQRERLRGEIAALTAEGRMSAIILGLMPPGLGLAIFTINPKYISTLFDTTIGNVLLGVSGVSIVIGFIWMKKIIDIDI